MNRQLLLALQKRNKGRLEELRTQIQNGEVTAEDLEERQKEVDELAKELQDIADALLELDDEENPEDEPEDDPEDDDPKDPEDNPEDDPEPRQKDIDPEQRNAILGAIGKGLSTRGHKSTKAKEKEIRSAFANFVVGNISEVEARSLGIVTGQGSVTVPESISSEIITYAQEENLLRKYGTPHPTKGNVKYPVLVKKAKANVTKTERTANMPETDIEFDEILLDPAEFDALATVSKKLIKMSGVNIEDIVVEELKKAYVEKEISYMFQGSDVGNENPGALAKKAVAHYESTEVVLDTDGWSQRLYSQLVKLKGQPVTEVLKKSMWIVNRAALTVLEEMTDKQGRPLLHEAVDGVGYKFLGHKLDFTDAADGTDVTKPVFYFGDFSTFHIQDVIGQLEIQRLVEQYAAQNKIGFQIYNLLDGQLIYSPLAPSVYRYEVGATE